MVNAVTCRARPGFRAFGLVALALLSACDLDRGLPTPADQPSLSAHGSRGMSVSSDPSGEVATVSTRGSIDLGNPFFQSLGTNGRTCATCHAASSAWGLSAAAAQAAYAASGGTDPLFAEVDGANCPSETAAHGREPYGRDRHRRERHSRDDHSLVLGYGLIRVALPVPADAEFSVAVVHDPFGCAADGSPPTLSEYRRPLPATNLGFLSAVMYDARETIDPLNDAATFSANLRTDLAHQALDATLGHAQATVPPTASQLDAIVDFERNLYTAQRVDKAAGALDAQGADGGPEALASTSYYPGINDPLGGNPTGAAFDPNAFTVYASWQDLKGSSRVTAARRAVARGEQVFNTHPLTITDVAGLNDALGASAINGTCSTCHDAPNVGDHSAPVPLDIGTSHAMGHETDGSIAAALAQLSAPDLPIYEVTCTAGPLAGTVHYTSDLGRALITGHCADLGRIKGPILRGLAARAPYFHNGAAATLEQVVEFYNLRFQMELTAQEKVDLVAFLRTL
jgi:cytochrome c peroxidase